MRDCTLRHLLQKYSLERFNIFNDYEIFSMDNFPKLEKKVENFKKQIAEELKSIVTLQPRNIWNKLVIDEACVLSFNNELIVRENSFGDTSYEIFSTLLLEIIVSYNAELESEDKGGE